MLNFVLQPSFGASLTVLAFVTLALKFLQPTVRWGIFGGLLTLGLAQAGWLLLGSASDPLVRSGHLAAALGFLWALAVCSMRWRFNEHGRLTARHGGIVVGQFLCLAACVFAVLVNVYFMVGRFGLSLTHTWSYTVLSPGPWRALDPGVPLDFALVAGACLAVTYSTRSAYLLVPFFWVLFLAVVRQCLLIPPVAPQPEIIPSNLTGAPSLWVLALLMGSALMLGGLVAVQGLSWKNSPRTAWRKDVLFLLRPPRSWPGVQQSVYALGMFVLALGCFLLVFPAPAGSFAGVLPAATCSVACLIAAVAVFAVANRRWTDSLGEVSIGLLTLSICCAVFVFVPRGPSALADRFPLLFNALVFGCGLSCLFWMWLAGVWEQQLDDQGRSWTTAGRLIPLAKRGSFAAGAFGVLFALQMGVWPVQDQVEGFDDSAARVMWGYAGMVLLMAALSWAYVKCRRPAFRTLLMLNSVALVFFGFVRILPRTGLVY